MVPSPIALGARESNDFSELSKLTVSLLPNKILNDNPHFDKHYKDVMMKSFKSNGTMYSLIINKPHLYKPVDIVGGKGKAFILFANKNAHSTANKLTISPEETVIIKWKNN